MKQHLIVANNTTTMVTNHHHHLDDWRGGKMLCYGLCMWHVNIMFIIRQIFMLSFFYCYCWFVWKQIFCFVSPIEFTQMIFIHSFVLYWNRNELQWSQLLSNVECKNVWFEYLHRRFPPTMTTTNYITFF